MGKKELTENEQMVLSYLALVDEYVKQTNNSDEGDKTTLGEQFTQIFDAMGEENQDEQQRVFYEGLVGLSKKECIVFSDNSFTSDIDNKLEYHFTVLEICKKGSDYVRKYMKMDNEKMEIIDRRIAKLSKQDLLDIIMKTCRSEVVNFVLKIFPCLSVLMR